MTLVAFRGNPGQGRVPDGAVVVGIFILVLVVLIRLAQLWETAAAGPFAVELAEVGVGCAAEHLLPPPCTVPSAIPDRVPRQNDLVGTAGIVSAITTLANPVAVLERGPVVPAAIVHAMFESPTGVIEADGKSHIGLCDGAGLAAGFVMTQSEREHVRGGRGAGARRTIQSIGNPG